jgi:hypothetical protein
MHGGESRMAAEKTYAGALFRSRITLCCFGGHDCDVVKLERREAMDSAAYTNVDYVELNGRARADDFCSRKRHMRQGVMSASG